MLLFHYHRPISIDNSTAKLGGECTIEGCIETLTIPMFFVSFYFADESRSCKKGTLAARTKTGERRDHCDKNDA